MDWCTELFFIAIRFIVMLKICSAIEIFLKRKKNAQKRSWTNQQRLRYLYLLIGMECIPFFTVICSEFFQLFLFVIYRSICFIRFCMHLNLWLIYLWMIRKNVQQTAVASQSRSTALFISIFKYSKINLNKFFCFKLQMLDKIIIIFPLELFISIKLFYKTIYRALSAQISFPPPTQG